MTAPRDDHPDHPHPRATRRGQPDHWRPAADLRGRSGNAHPLRSRIVVALLLGILGFGVIAQLRQTSEDAYTGLREDELVRLLDESGQRVDALEAQERSLRDTLSELQSSTDRESAAAEVAREQAETEGILAGRVPAEGPGIVLTVSDPQRQVTSAQLFSVLEELRNAGAEAIDVNDVRIVVSSSFSGGSGTISLDGHELDQPYVFTAIGSSHDLATALDIAGGATATLRTEAGAATHISESDSVRISSTREPVEPSYATPQSSAAGS